MIRVVLADDQQLVRAGFRVLLEAEEDIEVVGEAGDGEAALELVRSARPDVVLMDIRMPGVDGLARSGTRLMTRFARWVGQGRPDHARALRPERSAA